MRTQVPALNETRSHFTIASTDGRAVTDLTHSIKESLGLLCLTGLLAYLLSPQNCEIHEGST